MRRQLSIITTLYIVASPAAALAQSPKLSMEEIQAQLQQLSSQVAQLTSIVEEQQKLIKQQEAELEEQQKKSDKAIEATINETVQRHIASMQRSHMHETDGKRINITQSPTPKFETADGKFSFKPFGRVHLDATFFDNDQSSNENYSNIRRGRLGAEGKVGENLEYYTEIDFAEDETDIQDMTLTYTGLDHVDVIVGHRRPPIGFERNTSSNHNMLIERAVSTNIFSANRKLGASIATKGQDYAFGFGVHNEEAGGGVDNARSDDFSVDTRLAGNLLGLFDIHPEHVLHVGTGYSYQKPSDPIRYSGRPGIGDGARFIDTGNITDVETIHVANVELVGVFDSLSFQGEYFNSWLDRQSANANFSGYYAQLGYFLTGETRNYNRSTGLFSRTRILEDFNLKKGNLGAWELLARFESTDLNDTSAGITGGAMDLYTLGLNWYLNKNVRLMSNIIAVDTDDNAATAPNDDPTIFKLRAQWDF